MSPARPWLYAISAGLGPAVALDLVRLAAAAGVDFLQLREKRLNGGELYTLSKAALAVRGSAPLRLLLNDRLDIALAAGLDGVHLPAAGLPAEAARALCPPGFLMGVSCHSSADVNASADADYCLLGPIFPTPSKLGMGTPLGLATLEAAAAIRPVLALGGITAANAAACMAHGAAGIAAIRLFADATPASLRELRRAWGTGSPQSA